MRVDVLERPVWGFPGPSLLPWKEVERGGCVLPWGFHVYYLCVG